MVERAVWRQWQNASVIERDQDVVAMLGELADAVHNLERIYGIEKANLTVRAMILDWQCLATVAQARNLTEYKRV
jgi:hypothetical protein